MADGGLGGLSVDRHPAAERPTLLWDLHTAGNRETGTLVCRLDPAGINAYWCAGLWAYPNNWDSMTYHLTRVEHWMQRQTVIHYATNNVRQVSQPPLAEY